MPSLQHSRSSLWGYFWVTLRLLQRRELWRGVTICKEISVLSHPQHNCSSQVSNRPHLAALQAVTARQSFFGEGNPSSGPRHCAHIQAGAVSPLGWLLVGWDPKRRGSLSTWCWQLWEPGAGLVPAQQRLSTLPKGYPLSRGGRGVGGKCQLSPCPMLLQSLPDIGLTFRNT